MLQCSVNIFQTLRKYWYLSVSLILILALIPFFLENPFKAIVIAIVIIIWSILGILLKNFIISSFLVLLLILPFNITYQLPYSILGFELVNPFVDGVIVNYLIPTLSILDLGAVLLLFSMFFGGNIKLKWREFSFLKFFVLFGGYLIILSLLRGSFLSFFNSLRLLLYIFTFYNLLNILKDMLKQRVLRYVLIISIILVIFQGVLALLQFRGGSSVGVYLLGESKVVSGMMGSSFITLNNQLFLRGYGTFPHPNLFSGWLIFNIFLGWFLFDSMEKKRDYAIILMGLSSLVLLLIFSRIAFLVCTIVWISFLLKSFLNSKRIKNYAFFGLISERVLNLFTGGDTSWGDRIGLMKASFEVIKENILTGVGLGKFVGSMGDSVPRSSNGILLLQPVHNIFLLILSEIGLIGFGLFCTLLYYFLREKKRNLRFVIGLVALVIMGMFDHYLFSLPQGLGLLYLVLII